MNTLTFKKSSIWPDNSQIKWEINGIGKVDGKVKYLLRTEIDGYSEDSCFVSVRENNYDNWIIEDSPIVWSVNEWTRIYKETPEYAMKHQHHLARQAVMRWVEQHYEKSVRFQKQ